MTRNNLVLELTPEDLRRLRGEVTEEEDQKKKTATVSCFLGGRGGGEAPFDDHL
jgi:hypothetical protein